MKHEIFPKADGVNIASLPPEEQNRMSALESKTDTVYALRSQLADFYRNYRDRLPKSGTRRLHLREVQVLIDEGKTLPEILGLSSTDDLLEGDPDTVIRELDALTALEEALVVFRSLRDLGGDLGSLDKGVAADKDVARYYNLRWKELATAMQTHAALQAEARRLEDMREKVLNSHAHLQVLAKVDAKIQKLQTDAQDFFTTHPEAWIYAKALQLQDMKEAFDARGRIVETPYVKLKIQKIEEEVRSGRPVFIVGELGSGKTEVARQVAYTRLSTPHIQRWEILHPEPDAGDTEAHEIWLAARDAEREPIPARGHRNMEIDELLYAKILTRKNVPTPEEQALYVKTAWEDFKVVAQKQNWSDEDLREGGSQHDVFLSAYKDMFRSPIETQQELRAVLKAMKEGRPFLLDEMNAIPHHVLIVLNDFLTRQPGEIIEVPGIAPFRVQEGFCVIATGNYKPEDGKRYVGRQPLDAALLSRFAVISYDYLPMSETGGTRDEMEKNELLHMVAARFMEKNLTLEIPGGEMERLTDLCRVARQLQNIISDKTFNTGYYATVNGARVDPRDVLKENVLSIRHLLPIVDEWKKSGFRRSLDDLLFDIYVSKSDQRPAEKQYIYQMLQVQGGFFPSAQGWPDATTPGTQILTYSKAEERLRQAHAYTGTLERSKTEIKLHRYGTKELVEALFGPAPDRKTVPATFFEKPKESGPRRLEDTTLMALEALLQEQARLTAEATRKSLDLFKVE